MPKKSTWAVVQAIVAEQLGVELHEVTAVDATFDDLGADSLDYVELVMAVEEELEIEIDDDDLDQKLGLGPKTTVKQFADFVDARRK